MANGVTEADIRHWVHSFVWTGEYGANEITLLIEDNLGVGDKVDENWLREAIAVEVAAKRAAEQTWPAVTDWDRIDAAFRALERQGVIALHTAGFTQQDGLDDVVEVYHEAGGPTSGYAGHCFYTEQDQRRAVDGTGMYIGFGHLSGDDAKGVAVGHLLRAALEAECLNIDWDGTIESRLFVRNFRWQRRGPT